MKEKNKVGRPRLADTNLKKKSIIMIVICMLVTLSLLIVGIFSLTNFNTNKLKGSSSDKKFRIENIEYTMSNTVIPSTTYKIEYSCEKKVNYFKIEASFDNKNFKVLNDGYKVKNGSGTYHSYNNSFDIYNEDVIIFIRVTTYSSYKNLEKNNYLYVANFEVLFREPKLDSDTNEYKSTGTADIVIYTEPKKEGWQQENNKWYYYKDNKKLKSEWIKLNNKWYYLNSKGEMVTGWQKIKYNKKTSWYYFGSDGIMRKSKWVKSEKKYYYINSDGTMATGFKKISNNNYYFNSKGEMQTGWQKIKETWYYFGTKGVMYKGWLKSEKGWYYLDNNGRLIVNTSKTIDGEKYKFDKNGVCTDGKGCKEDTNEDTTTKNTTTTKASIDTADGLTLSCPSIAYVNEQFTCTTNKTGVKISVTEDGLAKGYNTSFTTTDDDKTKQSKYTKEIKVTVKATKKGYRAQTKTVTVKYKLEGGGGGHYTR